MRDFFLKSIFPEKLKKSIKEKLGVPSQEHSLKHIRNLGFNPQRCLDIGAFEGNWAIDFKALFPETAILMLEGQIEKEPILKKVKAKYSGIDYKIALLGAKEETVIFNKYETASSVLLEHFDTGAQTEARQLTTLDAIVRNSGFEYPDFIKVDTQGYELEILKGGLTTLSYAKFVLLEVSFLDVYKNGPLVAAVLYFMKSQGFVVYDICTLLRRPLDKSLFQSDFLFTKEQSSFRSDKRWS